MSIKTDKNKILSYYFYSSVKSQKQKQNKSNFRDEIDKHEFNYLLFISVDCHSGKQMIVHLFGKLIEKMVTFQHQSNSMS